MKGFKELMKPKSDMSSEPMGMPVPSLCLDSKQLPEVKDWKLGQEYTVKVRMTRRTEAEDGNVHADFEVIGAEGKDTAEQKTEGGKEDAKDASTETDQEQE